MIFYGLRGRLRDLFDTKTLSLKDLTNFKLISLILRDSSLEKPNLNTINKKNTMLTNVVITRRRKLGSRMREGM